jgi:type II secretory pathway pseudopilin PulG
MRKNFKAFTLVEMLIVMGIIIILMAVGIASGRFAIRRANRIEHQNAAEQIYQGLQSYYADNREYPDQDTPEDLVTGDLGEYIDDFDGGSEATYYYDVDGTNQVILVCVTHGGSMDENELGAYCTGNGVNSTDVSPSGLSSKDLEFGSEDYTALMDVIDTVDYYSEWEPASPWGVTESEV